MNRESRYAGAPEARLTASHNGRRPRYAAFLIMCALFIVGCGSTVSPAARPVAVRRSPGFSRVDAQPTLTTTTPAAPTLGGGSLVAGTVASASVGCGQAPLVPTGTSANQLMTSGGQRRSYRLHVPSGYDPNSATPLLLAFHGDGADGGSLEAYTGLSSVADAQGFLVAYPNGLPSAFGFTAWGGVGSNMPAVDDVQFTSDLIDQLSLTYCVDPSRVYATGFSRGGGMTALLACTLSDRIAAFAPVSGSFFSAVENDCAPTRSVPILDFHGSADSVVPYDGGGSEDFLSVPRWLAGWASRDGCSSSPQTLSAPPGVATEAWSGCSANSTVVHVRVLGAGHAWPGGDGGPQQIDASKVIWSFFQSYTVARAGP